VSGAARRALARELKARVRGEVALDVPLSPHTHYRAGGPADLALFPVDAEDTATALELLRDADCPVTVLGGGTNVLVSDRGVRGAVVLTSALTSLTVTGDDVVAGAGVQSHDVAEAARGAGLSGAEFLTCLPGTIGGACYMNARAYEGEVSEVLSRAATVTPEGQTHLRVLAPDQFAYKRSPFQGTGELIVEVTLALTPGDDRMIKERMEQIETSRRQRHELDYPSCGCVFKNDRDIGVSSGALIDRCGLKGYRAGDAQVSPHHGNFVFNTGAASAAELRRVMDHVRDTVQATTGHALEFEVQFLGDW